MAIPDWAVKFREKGTQITEIGGRYYLYRVKSKWDPEKHRARKITEEYLGRITPEGVKKQSSEGQVSVVEFGATDLIMRRCRYIIDALKIYDHWESILVMAIFRLLHASPLKRIDFYYQTSYMSEILEARTSPGFLSSLLRTIGLGRENTMIFLRHFVVEDDIAVIDLTTVFSMTVDQKPPPEALFSKGRFVKKGFTVTRTDVISILSTSTMILMRDLRLSRTQKL